MESPDQYLVDELQKAQIQMNNDSISNLYVSMLQHVTSQYTQQTGKLLLDPNIIRTEMKRYIDNYIIQHKMLDRRHRVAALNNSQSRHNKNATIQNWGGRRTKRRRATKRVYRRRTAKNKRATK